MRMNRNSMSLLAEVAMFLATAPSEDELLSFRPSKRAQARASKLLLKQNAGEIDHEEKCELDEMQHVESLMRLIMSSIHVRKARRQRSRR